MTEKLTTIKARILHIPMVLGITKQEFFRSVGLQYGNFTGANKDTQIGSDSLAKILSVYGNVNPAWLLVGHGEIFVSGDASRGRERGGASEITEANALTNRIMAEERRVHDEIVVSQQRTIERQQATIDKLVTMLENTRGTGITELVSDYA